MDFVARVKDLSRRSQHALQHALTEEATKTAVVMPLLQTLGFDVFNLEEVVPEFVADVGIKKGEKIDFALRIDGAIAILVEVKPITMSLGQAQFSQLYRYFGVLDARLAILTNGKEIWFFSDTDEKNKMDKKPFFTFDLQSHDENQVAELSRFQKTGFAIDGILEAATNLKHVKAASQYLKSQMDSPSEEFVRFVAREIYPGVVTKSVVEIMRPAIRSAFDEVVRGRIQDKLNVALRPLDVATEMPSPQSDAAPSEEVETTEEEQLAFLIVRAISARHVEPERITLRDAKSYCAVFMDNKNNRPVCRFYFNAKSVKRLGIFDANKVETRHDLAGLTDIYTHADAIVAAVKTYA